MIEPRACRMREIFLHVQAQIPSPLAPFPREVRLSLASERGETLVEPFVIRIEVPEE